MEYHGGSAPSDDKREGLKVYVVKGARSTETLQNRYFKHFFAVPLKRSSLKLTGDHDQMASYRTHFERKMVGQPRRSSASLQASSPYKPNLHVTLAVAEANQTSIETVTLQTKPRYDPGCC